MNYLALFYTTSGSVKFKRTLQRTNIMVEALPVPRKLSSSCGVAVRFSWPEDPLIFVDDSVNKLYRIEDDQYALIYNAD